MPKTHTLRERRLDAGLSQERLALLAGVSRATIARIEAHPDDGYILAYPKLATLRSLARTLDCSVVELVPRLLERESP